MKLGGIFGAALVAASFFAATEEASAGSLLRALFPPSQGMTQTAAVVTPVSVNPATQTTRQTVRFSSDQDPGTIIVDYNKRYLYLVASKDTAIRYPVAVARDGFEWQGSVKVGRMAKWPEWNAPAAMIKRRPDMPRYMKGGPGNPLGARALYLYDNGQDTMFRIHGTSEPGSIGSASSSGCIRMYNADVSDLYERIGVGTKVIVR